MRQSSTVPLVRAGAFLPFVNFLERHGVPTEQRLHDFLIPLRALGDVEALVPLDQALRFIEGCADKNGIPDLGLRVGAEAQLLGLGTFGRLILHSATLRDAIAKICQVTSFYNPAHEIWLEPWGEKARLCQRLAPTLSDGRRHGEQFTLMLMVDAIRKFAGPKWQPDEVHLAVGQWGLPVGALHFIDAPVRRNSVSGIVFDPAMLTLPPCEILPNGDGAEDRERRELEQTAPAQDFIGSMEQIVRMFLADERFGLEELAEVAGMSARTLQRRLAQCGEDFSSLVDRVRFKSSIDLASRGMRLIDVAYELGYADPASFTRAFKRWSGKTPTEFIHEWAEKHPKLTGQGSAGVK